MHTTKPIITLTDVTRTFLIPHERRATVREHVIHLFRRSEYEHLRVIDQISLTVQRGEFLGIVGKNGSGKSTLLKLLADIYPPTSGHIDVRGTVSPFLELGVGFHPELSAHDNVFLYGALLGIPRSRLNERLEHVLTFADLTKFADTKLKNFSSGMWARLAFSVAIEADADIYLFDEALAVGDEAFQRKCATALNAFKERGKTIIFVSHDLDAVRSFCTRCIYLRSGQIAYDGAPEEAITRYLSDVA